MEQILVLLVLILIPLINFVLGRIRQRAEPSPQSHRRSADMGMRRPARPPSETVQRPRPSEAGPVTIVQRPVENVARLKLFRSKRDMRRAIILMTVLGPCRANERAE